MSKAPGSERQALVPEGEYRATLTQISRFTNTHRQERLKFTYRIDSGPHAGTLLFQAAAISSSSWGKLTEVLRDLLGREPTNAELRDGPGSNQVGTRCLITVHVATKPTGAAYAAVQKATRLPPPLTLADVMNIGRRPPSM